MKRVIINAIGGLANRMRAILSARQLAKDTGRSLQVIWYLDKGCNIEINRLFDTTAFDFDVHMPSAGEYRLKYELPRKKNCYISALYQRRMLSFLENSNDLISQESSLKEIVSSSSKDVYVAAGTEFYDFDHELFKWGGVFVPSAEIVAELGGDMLFDGKKTIGVHIRRTDNVASISNSPTEAFINKMNDFLAEDGELRFFLATDDQLTKNAIVDCFGKERIITNGRKATRSTADGMKDAWCDMIRLSQTKLILGSYYSSFSEVASYLGGVRLEIINTGA